MLSTVHDFNTNMASCLRLYTRACITSRFHLPGQMPGPESGLPGHFKPTSCLKRKSRTELPSTKGVRDWGRPKTDASPTVPAEGAVQRPCPGLPGASWDPPMGLQRLSTRWLGPWSSFSRNWTFRIQVVRGPRLLEILVIKKSTVVSHCCMDRERQAHTRRVWDHVYPTSGICDCVR